MNKGKLLEILQQFKVDLIEHYEATPCSSGHINDTYKVTFDNTTPPYILQRINHHVFPNVEGLMNNYVAVTQHIRNLLEDVGENEITRKVVTLIESRNGKYYVQDDTGNYWRLMYFISNHVSYEQITDSQLAQSSGKAFANFLTQTADIPIKNIIEVIPNFHDIDFRLNNYRIALEKADDALKDKAKYVLHFIDKRMDSMRRIKRVGEAGKLPLRITHNDTKVNNILFDKETKQALCIIDLDTVMPGYALYDYGDAIRTGANRAEEDTQNLSDVGINIPIYAAYTAGYLEGASKILTDEEICNMPYATMLLPYLMCVRFITDYLDGNKYYKVLYPEHNLQRAKVQVKLIEDMEKHFEEMQSIVERLTTITNKKQEGTV